MLHDERGLALTTRSAEAVTAFDRMVAGFVAHGTETADALGDALAADPGLTLGHAAQGFFCFLLARRELTPRAAVALAAAQDCLAERGGTPREHLYVRGLAAVLNGDLAQAVDRLSAVISNDPLDALAIKLDHALRFIRGDAAGMRAATTRILPAWTETTPLHGFILGCHAFGLEETGDYVEAEKIGRRAVDLAPRDTWGRHAVAHVYEMTGATEQGIAWLSGYDGIRAGCNNLRFHVTWHLALFLLETGDTAGVLRLYDGVMRKDRTDDFRDIANAVSLLWRLEQEGVDVGPRWAELADLAERRSHDHCLVFADLHYLMALIGAKRHDSAGAMLAALTRFAANDTTEQAAVCRTVGLPLAHAMAASRTGHAAEAARLLAAVRDRIRLIGGSHAQRDVFERTLIDAMTATDPNGGAAALLRARLERRNGDRFALRKLSALSMAPCRAHHDRRTAAEPHYTGAAVAGTRSQPQEMKRKVHTPP